MNVTLDSETPRVDEVIEACTAKCPGETPRALAAYFEDVHQVIAPLARQMEREVAVLLKALREIERHHVELNTSRGRPVERSKTVTLVRAAIKAIGGRA